MFNLAVQRDPHVALHALHHIGARDARGFVQPVVFVVTGDEQRDDAFRFALMLPFPVDCVHLTPGPELFFKQVSQMSQVAKAMSLAVNQIP